jgi:hypothetical protein
MDMTAAADLDTSSPYVVTIYGASDDLIEIEGGQVTEELTYVPRGDGQYIALSNGVMLHIEYDEDGVWRIKPVRIPNDIQVLIKQCPVASSGDEYSDRALVDGPVDWVLVGDELSIARGVNMRRR